MSSVKFGSQPDSIIKSAFSTHLTRTCMGRRLTIFNRFSELLRSDVYPIWMSVIWHRCIRRPNLDNPLESLGLMVVPLMSWLMYALAIICGRPYILDNISNASWYPSVGSRITQSWIASFASPLLNEVISHILSSATEFRFALKLFTNLQYCVGSPAKVISSGFGLLRVSLTAAAICW